jgi:hypothetical protein
MKTVKLSQSLKQRGEQRITLLVLLSFALITGVLITATACTENQKQSYSITK